MVFVKYFISSLIINFKYNTINQKNNVRCVSIILLAYKIIVIKL